MQGKVKDEEYAMQIGEVATRTGVSTKALRFYEAEGLLPEPRRTANGYRDFDAAAVGRVAFIKDAQSAGFTLAQVRGVLDVRDGGRAPCEHVTTLIASRLAEVEGRLRELRSVRKQLRDLAARAELADPDACEGYCSIITP